ncbi:MAG: hypothetical protein LH480_09615 [Rubrivivax sp.]|nr:hypothetical protein [Rubrivivax sp.]
MPHPAASPPVESFAEALPLVEIIELKWLLAGLGVRLHVERLQQDPAYVRRALEAAAASPSVVVRKVALRLQCRLQCWLLPPG